MRTESEKVAGSHRQNPYTQRLSQTQLVHMSELQDIPHEYPLYSTSSSP